MRISGCRSPKQISQKRSYSGYRENTHKKERLKFRRIKIIKTQMLHTSLICPFSVLAWPTVIFLKKRSFVSTTEKQKQKDSLISWKISHEIYYFEIENWRNIRDTQKL